MFILDQYDEFSPGMGFPSIYENISQEAYPNKEIILHYLHSAHVHMVTASRFIDVFTGAVVNRELVFMNDNKYTWSSKIPYYVEKYNLLLPEHFVKHVLENSRF